MRQPFVGLIDHVPAGVRHVAAHDRGAAAAFDAIAQCRQHPGAQIAFGLTRETDVEFERERLKQRMIGVG